jgi:two-component system, cell cycle response regulator
MERDKKAPALTPLFDDDEAERTLIGDALPIRAAIEGPQLHAYLIVLAGTNVGAVYRLGDQEITLGRSKKAGINLDDTNISRAHASLTLLGQDEVLLKDLGSTNGTFVGEERISSKVLRDGDRFQLGSTTLLKFSVSDEVEESFQRQLYESSVRDGLTGLNNRKHFDERLEAEFTFALRHGAELTLILVDIDHFKRINDTYGHQAGDEVLRRIARGLKKNTRTEDIVARYGGEEFAVIARGISPAQGLQFGSRLRVLIKATPIQIEGTTIHVSVSAGVATLSGGLFKDQAALIAATDRALYSAKAQGRDRVVLADECRTLLDK